MKNILEEINRLNNRRANWTDLNVIISSNIPLKNDGFPRADYFRSNLTDKGVAVYFKYGKKDMVLCCDRWTTVEDNMKAIFTTIEAIRGIERWGVSDFIERSFQGFAALPEGRERKWFDVMGFSQPPVELVDVKTHYRTMSKELHPDNGGSHELQAELNNAYAQALRHYGENGK